MSITFHFMPRRLHPLMHVIHFQMSTSVLPVLILCLIFIHLHPSEHFIYRRLHPSEHFILQTSTPFRALHFTDIYTLPSTSFYRRLHPSEHFILQTSTPFRARNFLRKTFPEIYILLSVMLHLVSRCQI